MDDALATTKTVLTSYLLPTIKTVLESSKWDPKIDVERALDLYNLLFSTVKEIDSRVQQSEGSFEDNEAVLPREYPDETEWLVDFVRQQLIHDVVYAKLSRSVREWKPKLDSRNKMSAPLHAWVLPWLPHLDHRALLPSLVSECKRKVRSAASYLEKTVDDDVIFVQDAIELLSPWRGIFKEKTVFEIVSSSITPRLARSLAALHISEDATGQDWRLLHSALNMNDLGLLSNIDLLSVVEGEVLPRWTRKIHDVISSSPQSEVTKLVENYVIWKNNLLLQPARDPSATSVPSHSRLILGQDAVVGRYFCSVLIMARAAKDSDGDTLDGLVPPYDTNYRVVLARRVAEEKKSAADDLIRMEHDDDKILAEARVRLSRSNKLTPTFRDVVAEFAREKDLLFQPRVGNNATVDGKQIFLFGGVPIFLDSNVVFYYRKGEWAPIPLEELAYLASQQVSQPSR
jgi:hypothetical protein